MAREKGVHVWAGERRARDTGTTPTHKHTLHIRKHKKEGTHGKQQIVEASPCVAKVRR